MASERFWDIIKNNMSKKVRLIIFISLVITYFIVAPILIYYALGYRFNFDTRTVISTGGFDLKIWPQETNILIDQKIVRRTNIFSNDELIQGLLPKKYNIAVEKEGYFTWDKNLNIEANKVTKLENVTLIKESLAFQNVKGSFDNFYISPDEKYILTANEASATFHTIDSSTLDIVNTFTLQNPKDLVVSWNTGSETVKLYNKTTPEIIYSINYKKTGTIIPEETPGIPSDEILSVQPVTVNGITLVKDADYISLLNTKTDKFEKYYQAKDWKFSPDKSKFLFFNDHEILFAKTNAPTQKIFLIRFSGIIDDCFWLNNDYVIYNVGGKLKISEIDTRDKINTVDLKVQLTTESDAVTTLINPEIHFDTTNKILYILNEKNLFVSEPLTDKKNK